MQETWVWSLGREDPLKEMATCSSILAWKIPWTEETGGLPVHRVAVGHDWATEHTHTVKCSYKTNHELNSINNSYFKYEKEKKTEWGICFGKTVSVKNILILIKLVLLTDDEEKSHISLVQDKKIMNYRRNT